MSTACVAPYRPPNAGLFEAQRYVQTGAPPDADCAAFRLDSTRAPRRKPRSVTMRALMTKGDAEGSSSRYMSTTSSGFAPGIFATISFRSPHVISKRVSRYVRSSSVELTINGMSFAESGASGANGCRGMALPSTGENERGASPRERSLASTSAWAATIVDHGSACSFRMSCRVSPSTLRS